MLPPTAGRSVKTTISTPRALPMKPTVVVNMQNTISISRGQFRPASTASPRPISKAAATATKPRAAGNLLLISEILLPVEQVQRADRGLMVAAPTQR